MVGQWRLLAHVASRFRRNFGGASPSFVARGVGKSSAVHNDAVIVVPPLPRSVLRRAGQKRGITAAPSGAARQRIAVWWATSDSTTLCSRRVAVSGRHRGAKTDTSGREGRVVAGGGSGADGFDRRSRNRGASAGAGLERALRLCRRRPLLLLVVIRHHHGPNCRSRRRFRQAPERVWSALHRLRRRGVSS